MTACGKASQQQLIKQTPPRVDCKQEAGPLVKPLPPANQMIEVKDGEARISEVLADWISDLLGVADKRQELRSVEHKCLDDHERKGVITQ